VRATWAPKGQTPVIRHHFNWKKVNVIGTIACKPNGSESRILLHTSAESVDFNSIIWFLDALHREIPGRVVLLWDGLPAHRSNVVKDHVEKNKEWLQVERFPAYAPELNPLEYLWSTLKGKDVANFCPDTLADIEQNLHDATSRIQSESGIIVGFLRASTLYDDSTLVTTKGKDQ